MIRQRLVLSADALMAKSRQLTDVELVDHDIIEPLTILLHSLAEEARLDAEGCRAWEAKLLRLLGNRLRMKRDFLRHPEIAEQPLNGPLVIMGVARSGTTKLQKLLASSGDFNFLTFWQNFNWASVSGEPGEPVAERIAEADAFCRWFERRSPDARLGHHFAALEPEEEGPLSEGCFVAPSFLGYAELPGYAAWLAGQPRTRFFRFLRDVLKYLQWQGLANPDRPWLLKSPNYNGLELQLREVFPEARFVVANRSPLKTLASMCKLVECLRGAFGEPSVDQALIVEGNYRSMDAHLANRRAHPQLPVLDLRFEDIVADSEAVVQNVYRHAGMALTTAAADRMRAWDAVNTMHRHGEFNYSLADAGLDEAVIRARMADYFAHLNSIPPAAGL